MKSRQITALLLSAVMMISACVPAGIQAYAAEDAGTGASSEIVEMATPEEETGEEAAQTAGDDGEQNIEDAQQTDKEETEDIADDANDESVQNESEAGENEEIETESVIEETEPEQEESVDAEAEEEKEAPSVETAEEAEEEAAEEEAADDEQEPAAVPENNDAEDEEITEAVVEEPGEDAALSGTSFSDATVIAVGGSQEVSVQEDQTAYLKFTPEKNGNYVIYSESDDDTYGSLYDSNKELIDENDDDGEDSNFWIEADGLKANTTYYIAVHGWQFRSVTMTVYVGYGQSKAYYVSSDEINTSEGSRITLEAGYYLGENDASDQVTVTWYYNGEAISSGSTYTMASGETETCSFVASEQTAGNYTFEVSAGDFYDSLYFYVSTFDDSIFTNAQELTVGTAKTWTASNDETEKVFKFTARKDGTYTVFNDGRDNCNYTLYEFDSGSSSYTMMGNGSIYNDDDSYIYTHVENGKTYYIQASAGPGSAIALRLESLVLERDSSERVTASVGENVMFETDVSDGNATTFKWYAGTSLIAGANDSYYSFTARTAGTYYCEATDGISTKRVSFTLVLPTKTFANAVSITAGTSQNVTVTENEPFAYHKFTPTVTGDYEFRSEGDIDTYVRAYTQSGSGYEEIDSNDDSGTGSNFRLRLHCYAGKTYYFKTYRYSKGAGSFTIFLQRATFTVEYVSSDEFYVNLGEQISPEVRAYGSSNYRYQWYLEGEAISGATAAKYTFAPQNGGKYSCRVTDGSYTMEVDFWVYLYGANGDDLRDLRYATVRVPAVVYNGAAQKPAPVVKMNGNSLSAGRDYTISYVNNINAGTATVKVTGIGSYTGAATKTFTISKAAAQRLTASPAVITLTAGESRAVTVTGAKEGLALGNSSTVASASVSGRTVTVKGLAVGTFKLTVKGDGKNYNQSAVTITVNVVPGATKKITATNQVKGIKLTWKKVPGATGYLVYRDKKLVKTVKGTSYTDKGANKNGKKYVFKIVAKAASGTSTKSKSLTTYRTARPGLKSVTSEEPNTIKITWSKNAKGNGYEILYGLKKNLKGAKKVKITKKATLQRLVKKLKSGKTYYVKVRAYKKAGSKKYYSAWSVTKKIQVK